MLYRIYPTKDTSVANRDETTDAAASNVGASEIMNLYRTASGTATVLVAFDTSTFPTTGSLYLKLFDAQHDTTIPRDYTVAIAPLEQSWSEGHGHDLDFYTDIGEASWNSSSLGVGWATAGAFPSGTSSVSFSFGSGHEDLSADVTTLSAPHGYHVSISSPGTGTYYIKKFHSRDTHFYERRPFLELRNSDWTGTLSTSSWFLVTTGAWSGSYVEARLSGGMTGQVVDVTESLVNPTGSLIIAMPDLKSVYEVSEFPTIRMSVRSNNWSPPTFATSSADAPAAVLLDAYYRVVDDVTGRELVPFGTGALPYTKMSYEDQGNYFRFFMGNLSPGSMCRFDVLYQISGSWTLRLGTDFKFRVR
jgi:hypothetical protein